MNGNRPIHQLELKCVYTLSNYYSTDFVLRRSTAISNSINQ